MTSEMADAQRIKAINDYSRPVHLMNYFLLVLNIVATGLLFFVKFPKHFDTTVIATIVAAITSVLSIVNTPVLDRFMANKPLLAVQGVIFTGLFILCIPGLKSALQADKQQQVKENKKPIEKPAIDSTIKK